MNIKRNPFRAVLGALAVSISIMLFGPANRADAVEAPGDLLVDSAADLQIDHSGTTEPSDTFSLEATFTNNDQTEGGCDGDDPVAQGLTITLGSGTCGSSTDVVSVVIPPFSSGGGDARLGKGSKKHGHKKHKTHFTLKMPVKVTDPSTGGTEDGSLNAEITVLPTPAGTCGQWSLNVDVSKVDLSALTANPVAVTIGQGDDSGCNDQIAAQFDSSGDGGDGGDGGGDGGGDNGGGGGGNGGGDGNSQN
jgi:hypothetical protein